MKAVAICERECHNVLKNTDTVHTMTPEPKYFAKLGKFVRLADF